MKGEINESMFRNIYIFILRLEYSIKGMSDSEFSDLLSQCTFQQAYTACYMRYL